MKQQSFWKKPSARHGGSKARGQRKTARPIATNAAKSRPVGRFWAGLIFTRIVEWGRDYLGMLRYLAKNALQAAGIPRGDIDKWFKEAFG